MNIQVKRITNLIIRHLKQEQSVSEARELEDWMNLSEQNRLVAEEFLNEEKLKAGIAEIYNVEKNVWQKLEQQLDNRSQVKELYQDLPPTNNGKIISLIKRISVAASIIVVIGITSYFLFFDKRNTQTDAGQNLTLVHDIEAPANNRAMITLSDGRTVYLDSAGNGTLASQSGTNVIKTADGQIAYQIASSEISKKVQYNTLTNPRGSQVISMMLSDGSRIWLNAGSSVTYPVAFIGNERGLSINGEAYFEIMHDASMPFKVKKGEVEITVLGTQFNVNAYDDESALKVTLVEGSVKVQRSVSDPINNSTILKPGQQAVISQDAGIEKLNTVDIEKIMAWKQNVFMFSGDDLQSIMRQLSRWYNIEVSYKQKANDRHFTAIINRDNNISEVLKMLQATGKVDFNIQGKKIIVE